MVKRLYRAIFLDAERPRYRFYSAKTDLEMDIQSYRFFREEINREDGITEKRLNAFLGIQGFLIAGLGIVVSNGIGETTVTWDKIIIFRYYFLVFVILTGVFSSFSALLAVVAARLAIADVIYDREADKDNGIIYDVEGLPHAHGYGISYTLGAIYPIFLTLICFILWFGVGTCFILTYNLRYTPNWASAIFASRAAETARKENDNKICNLHASCWIITDNTDVVESRGSVRKKNPSSDTVLSCSTCQPLCGSAAVMDKCLAYCITKSRSGAVRQSNKCSRLR